jgi:hypothetical protein
MSRNQLLALAAGGAARSRLGSTPDFKKNRVNSTSYRT